MFADVKLNIDFDQFVKADYSIHEGSCIQHQVYELTDIHAQYGGFPDSIVYANTKINQLWWDKSSVDFDNIGDQLGMDVVTVSSIRQPAGCIIPLHRDMFFQVKKAFPDRPGLHVRANIFLEDYRLGHFLQYIDEQEQYVTATNWKAGDGFLWDSKPLHLSANAGFEFKYTLQVSGFLR